MKKILFLICALCICLPVFGKTINWYVDSSVYDTTTCSTGGDLILPTAPTKRGYTFMGWVNYIPIEYLESTGTQYIDLGRKVRSDYTYKIKVAWTRFGPYTFMSSKENSDWKVGRYLGIPYYDISTGEKTWYSRGSTKTNPVEPTMITVSANTPFNFDWKPTSGSININGTAYGYASGSAQTTDVFETANNMYLFAANSGGAVTAFDYVKLYSWQMYDTDGTTLLMNLIPAKDSSNVVGMYDTVSGQFFTNQGTGDFVAGPEI